MYASANTRWDRTVDVVVVGYGLAGAVAAITARERGSIVAILEKQEAASHYNPSSLSGGVVLSWDDAGGAAAYLEALAGVDGGPAWTDRENIRALAEYGTENVSWLRALGGKVDFLVNAAEHASLPGANAINAWQYKGKGLRMMQLMNTKVQQCGVEVVYEARALRLLTNGEGRVIGVRTGRDEGSAMNWRARKGVILCSGGFEGNEEMKKQYLGVYPVYFTGGGSNTGDGIKMAQEVGADLWHMNCVTARLVAKFAEYSDAFPITFEAKTSARGRIIGLKDKATLGYIFVDRYGRRYMSEKLLPQCAYYEITNFDTHKLEYPKAPSYYVFDQRRIVGGALCYSGICGPQQIYHWSASNQAELDKGWITKGDTVDELAGKLGMNPATLTDTVKHWNDICARGNDPEFNRPHLDLVPLDNPPYYAIKLFPGGPNTHGGPRRNSRAQVLTPFGAPIPGLFSAGECGSVYGKLYPAGGASLAECIAFGRIAGESAAKEG
ncbi:MAG: FAD-binding protein [Chloroflexi bacterium]|nr:FAD-binding protein [Chloroflexota bacterium]